MNKNNRVALNLVMIIVGMLLLVAASPSLYRAFCQITGIDGTPKISLNPSDKIINRTVRVQFDTNIDKNLNWEFEPEQEFVDVKIGENKLVYFKAKNLGKVPQTGRAIYGVTPEKVAKYFNKVQCFCFENQLIKPGQTIDFPVSFFVDPEFAKDKFMDDVESITLYYTFYESAPK